MLASIAMRADMELEAAHRAHVQVIVLQGTTPHPALPLAQLPWTVLGAVPASTPPPWELDRLAPALIVKREGIWKRQLETMSRIASLVLLERI